MNSESLVAAFSSRFQIIEEFKEGEDDDDEEENQDDLVQDTRSCGLSKDPSQDSWHGEEMYVFLHGSATCFSREPRKSLAATAVSEKQRLFDRRAELEKRRGALQSSEQASDVPMAELWRVRTLRVGECHCRLCPARIVADSVCLIQAPRDGAARRKREAAWWRQKGREPKQKAAEAAEATARTAHRVVVSRVFRCCGGRRSSRPWRSAWAETRSCREPWGLVGALGALGRERRAAWSGEQSALC